jgi:anion-transporting  ArsA/GET3 family ATPase
MVQMVDVERVVTLDELMERVPEHLVREAESKSDLIEQLEQSPSSESNRMSKEPSKAQRIRAYMEANPEARNKDIVEALDKYDVKAADVANVKAHIKRTGGEKTPAKRGPVPSTAGAPAASTGSGFPNVNLKHLEAAVDFVKLVGSVQDAQHLLIIVERVKNA